jgi:hypothetical protein
MIEEEEILIFTSEENISEFAAIHTKHKKNSTITAAPYFNICRDD